MERKKTMTLIEQIEKARDDDQARLDRILAKYDNGGMYSSEDAEEQDYLEGKVTAYDHVIIMLKGQEQ